jgi:hypothetical protein
MAKAITGRRRQQQQGGKLHLRHHIRHSLQLVTRQVVEGEY